MFWVKREVTHASEEGEKEEVVLSEENCMLLSYMITQVEKVEKEFIEAEMETREPEIPQALEKKSAEELASELLEYIKKEFPDAKEGIGLHEAIEMFWKEKGWDEFEYNPKISIKMEKAESMAERRLTREQFEKEKEILPKLVNELVEWAMNEGLKRVYKYNVVSFLQEKEVELTQQSTDVLFNKVNIELKKKTGK